MVGPEYEFLFADVRMNGRNSDGGKLVSVLFEEWFREKHIEFPRYNTPSLAEIILYHTCVQEMMHIL